MRKMLLGVMILSLVLVAQDLPQGEDGNAFSFFGGMGADFMNDTLWFRLSLQPELSLGPVGVGLDIPFRFNTQGDFRSADWDSPSDIMATIRYLRLGKKYSPFYFRIGVLDHVTLAYGFLMDNYTNTIDENTRKSGVLIESDMKKFGAQVLYSNLGKPEVFGLRAFVRPIWFVAPIPIIRNFEIGGTYVKDFHPDADIAMASFDAGLPLRLADLFSLTFYYDYGKALNYGSGTALGVRTDIRLPSNLVQVSAKFEKRRITNQFIPSYFDPFYEAQRAWKDSVLASYNGNFDGYYGELYATALGKLKLGGTYTYFMDIPYSGRIHLVLDATQVIKDWPLLVMWDRDGIESSRDIVFLGKDEHTVFTFVISHRLFWKVYGTGTIQQKFAYNEATDTYDPLRKYGFMVGVKL